MDSLKKETLCCFPKKKLGQICDYNDGQDTMPCKIVEMGLVPGTKFRVLYQAPFRGPLYVEFGTEKSRLALREEEARYIQVESL
ncbi:ferrous iron transport protein A [Cruoricaptor ignavus]|uniref:FeoA family protein n=1 Tax=Cruoricaptor ignavus TaxID=1118202 RepID=UPI00370D763F